jgi:hypothetical protein
MSAFQLRVSTLIALVLLVTATACGSPRSSEGSPLTQ